MKKIKEKLLMVVLRVLLGVAANFISNKIFLKDTSNMKSGINIKIDSVYININN